MKKKCTNCRNYLNSTMYECHKCATHPRKLPYWESAEKTRGDKIRAMNDEDLTDAICKIRFNGAFPYTREAILKWVQEVEE